MSYINQLKANIDDLVKKTSEKKFTWVRENPTTFYFEQPYEGKDPEVEKIFLVSLQTVKLSRPLSKVKVFGEEKEVSYGLTPVPSSRYILQIKDLDLNRIDLKIDTLDKHYGKEIYGSLEKLYETVRNQVSSRSLDVFDKVLGNS